ncbi:ATP-dependent RNA helicase Has1 [Vairimorpha necatrix]|uniref:ATP-dependent RNA helicase n=1 Tax=Vairimorpha necatrix TaxID=6039 RepID=A0AAX4JDV5_9MICR
MSKLLFSETSLNSKLKEILEKNNFLTLTNVQEKTLPLMLNNKDIVVQSQTGSGKTLSFVLPILHNYLKNQTFYKNHPVCLVIVPTRELALQIEEVFKMFEIKTRSFIGGYEIEEDLKDINNDYKIIVGTPGRLLEIIKKNSKIFSKISNLILDEADRLINLGFKEKVLDIVSLLPKSKSCSFFSATINEDIKNLSKSILKNPVFVDNVGNEIPDNLLIRYLNLKSNEKLIYTLELVTNKKSIVFFATCNQVDFFYDFLIKFGKKNIYKIHRKMKQDDRNNVYKNFYDQGEVLLCTDVAARGIDFKNINLVIHFDIPSDYNNIIHRSGRTARNGLKGESILFVMPNETSYLDYLSIKKLEIKEIQYKNSLQIEELKKIMDDELYKLSVKAFVSYFRSYKEHSLSYILDYTTLNYDELVDLYMLKKIPGMTELRNVEFKNFPREKPIEEKRRKSKKSKKNK